MVPQSEIGGTFFMDDFKTTPDALLAIQAQNGDEEAARELCFRFKGHSIRLAKELSGPFGKLVDISDLISVGLFSLALAIKNYSRAYSKDVERYKNAETFPPFMPFWRKIAQRHMYSVINDAIEYQKNVKIMATSFISQNKTMEFGSYDDEKSEFMIGEIKEWLDKKCPQIKQNHKDMFIDYLNGLSITELSRKYRLSNATTKKHVESIRVLVYDNLFK